MSKTSNYKVQTRNYGNGVVVNLPVENLTKN